jgi:hypothetical protein
MSGGGVALGPKPRSYAQHTPKKMVRLALLSALSDRADIGRIAVLDDWGIEEPDTREAATILRKLKLKGSVLVVLANDEINLALSLRNLPEASITTHAELSAHDVVRADWIIFSERTLPTSPSNFADTHHREAPPKPTKPKAPDAAPAAKAAKAAPAKKAAKATKATKAAAADVEKAAGVTEAEAEVELPAGSDEASELEGSETEGSETEATEPEATEPEATEKPAKKAPARRASAAKKAKEGDDDA